MFSTVELKYFHLQPFGSSSSCAVLPSRLEGTTCARACLLLLSHVMCFLAQNIRRFLEPILCTQGNLPSTSSFSSVALLTFSVVLFASALWSPLRALLEASVLRSALSEDMMETLGAVFLTLMLAAFRARRSTAWPQLYKAVVRFFRCTCFSAGASDDHDVFAQDRPARVHRTSGTSTTWCRPTSRTSPITPQVTASEKFGILHSDSARVKAAAQANSGSRRRDPKDKSYGTLFSNLRCFATPRNGEVKIPQMISDDRFDKKLKGRVRICDLCGRQVEWGGQAIPFHGNFVHAEEGKQWSPRGKEQAWKDGRWNATWYCVVCLANLYDVSIAEAQEQFIRNFREARANAKRLRWLLRGG